MLVFWIWIFENERMAEVVMKIVVWEPGKEISLSPERLNWP